MPPAPEVPQIKIPDVASISVANRENMPVRPATQKGVDVDAEKNAARKFIEDLESGNRETRNKAQDRVAGDFQKEKAARGDIQVDEAKQALRETLEGARPSSFIAGNAIEVALNAEHNTDVIHAAQRILEVEKGIPEMSSEAVAAKYGAIFHESAKLMRGSDWGSLTPEARAEATDFLERVLERFQTANIDFGLDKVLIEDNLNPDRLTNPLAPDTAGLKKVFDESDEDKRTFSNTELQERLRKIQNKLDHDPSYRRDPEAIRKDLTQIVEDMSAHGFTDAEIRIAVQRIERFVNRANRAVREQRLRDLSGEGHVLIWSDKLRDALGDSPHGDRITGLRGKITQKEVEDMFIYGREYREKWYSDWWHNVHRRGREPERAGLEEEMVWTDFQRILEWGLPETGRHELESFEIKRKQLNRLDVASKAPFASGDIKEFYNTLRRITPQDYEDLISNFALAEYANSLIRQAAPDMITWKMYEYKDALEFLREKLTAEEIAWIQDVPASPGGKEKHFKNLMAELEHKWDKKAEDITHDQVLSAFQDAHGRFNESDLTSEAHRRFGELTPEADKLMRRIQQARDKIGRGAFLEDSDMLEPTALWNTMSDKHTAYEEVKNKLARGSYTSSAEKNRLEAQKTELDSEIRDLWKQITKNDQCGYNAEDGDLITDLYGMAPVDFIVRDRMIQYGATKYHESELAGNPDESWHFKEWQMRDAIWAARTSFLAWGESADLAASYYMGNALDLISQTSLNPSGKDIMPAPHMEPIVRVKNPYAFADRFSIGRAVGDEMRNIKYQKFVDKYYPGAIAELKSKPEWYDRYKTLQKKRGEWRVVIQYLAETYQIPYSELLKPNPMRTGLHFNSSTWRAEIGILEAYQSKFKREGLADVDEAILDNQGLSLRLNLLRGTKPHEAQQRKQLLYKKMERSPNEIMQLMAGNIDQVIEQVNRGKPDGLRINNRDVEWKQFLNSLTDAQMEGWNVKEFETGIMNLMDRNTFNRVVKPFMETMHISADRIEVYYEFLDKLYAHARNNGLLDGWSRMTLPVILPLSDFNWKKTRFDLLNVYSAERRINDNINMVQARDAEFAMDSIDLAAPADWMETLKKLNEYINNIVSYDGVETAEDAAQLYLEAFGEFNKDRAVILDTIGPPGWAIKWALKNAREIEVEKMPAVWLVTHIFPGAKEFVEQNKPLMGRPIKDWPRSLSRVVSYNMYHTGAEGNAYNEAVFAEIFNAVERMGMFQDHPEKLVALRHKFGGTYAGHLRAVSRKYIWYAFFATMAAAAMQGIEEEKKKG